MKPLEEEGVVNKVGQTSCLVRGRDKVAQNAEQIIIRPEKIVASREFIKLHYY